MQDEQRLALMLGRMVDLLGKQAGGDEPRAALSALVDLTNRGSATVRFENESLTVEGATIPRDLPFVGPLMARFQSHGVAEIRIAHRAAPLDLLDALRELAEQPASPRAQRRQSTNEPTTVQIVGAEEDKLVGERRRVRITDALRSVVGDTPSGPVRPGSPAPQEYRVSTNVQNLGPPTKLDVARASTATPVTSAVTKIQGLQNMGELSQSLKLAAAGVSKAIEQDRLHVAVDATINLVRQEAKERREAASREYAVALRRIFQPAFLRALPPFLLDPLYADDVAEILRRVGRMGTELLVDLLVSAGTFAERKALMEALRQIESGKDIVVSLLSHHEWFVVRNAADLVGELKIEEGIGVLGKAAKHEDPRVRRSVGIALARIGTPTAARHLNHILRDGDPAVRIDVLKHVAGKGMSALVMPLVQWADKVDDEGERAACYHALGRIGTGDALQTLVHATKSTGILQGRRAARRRIAAVEGLGEAGNKTAEHALKSLARDKAKPVREAARTALTQIARNAGVSAPSFD